MSKSVVVVTGALTGIGEATAKAFAQRGDVVVLSGRHDDVGEQLAHDLKDAGAADALFVRADVRFSMRSVPVTSTPRCSPESPEALTSRAPQPPQSRKAARDAPKRSPRRSCICPAARLPT